MPECEPSGPRLTAMRALRLALLVLLTCAGCTPMTVTPCGMAVDRASWLAGDLGAAEATVREHLALTGDPRLQSSCAALDGVTVLTRAPGSWEHADADAAGAVVEVDGLADCDLRTITLTHHAGEPWQFGSLAHEMTHQLTECDGHRDWDAKGIRQALTNIYFTTVPDVR